MIHLIEVCMEDKKKWYVSWCDVQDYVKEVADRYSRASLTGVYGLPRGGLVLATMISHRMNIPMLMAPTPGCLIVDDVSDSGRSLIHFTENDTQFNQYHISTMYCDPRTSVVPEYYFGLKNNEWLVFPWEEF